MSYRTNPQFLSVLCFFFFFLCFSSCRLAFSFDFEVGDESGWKVPPSNETDAYNRWASRNRFVVGDTISFRYKKDSVMEVEEEEYNKCSSSHPLFFSNHGRTEFKLDRPGTFYFISGASGHCHKGQKVIIKVMGHSETPRGSPSAAGDQSEDQDYSGAAAVMWSRVFGMGAHVVVFVTLVGVFMF